VEYVTGDSLGDLSLVLGQKEVYKLSLILQKVAPGWQQNVVIRSVLHPKVVPEA
jgi:hypothetical protein